MAAEIHSPCPSSDCGGSTVFVPVAGGSGAIGECDLCGGVFRLKDGRADMLRGPRVTGVYSAADG